MFSSVARMFSKISVSILQVQCLRHRSQSFTVVPFSSLDNCDSFRHRMLVANAIDAIGTTDDLQAHHLILAGSSCWEACHDNHHGEVGKLNFPPHNLLTKNRQQYHIYQINKKSLQILISKPNKITVIPSLPAPSSTMKSPLYMWQVTQHRCVFQSGPQDRRNAIFFFFKELSSGK